MIYNQIPVGWRSADLETLAEVNPDTLGATTPQDFRFRYIDLSSVKHGTISWSATQEMHFRSAPSRARRKLQANDVLFGTVRPALQSHGSIPPFHAGDLVASTGFAVLRARANAADARFLHHYVLSRFAAEQARRFELGSNYPAVNEGDVRRFSVLAPTLTEQRRIAGILDTLDEAIRKTEQLIAKLKQVQQGLLHDLLTRGIDDNGRLRDPAQHPEQFYISILGLIPRTWSVQSAWSVCDAVIDCKNRTPPVHSEGYPVIRTPNVRNGEFITDGLVYTDAGSYKTWTQRGKPRAGDVLITREAPVGEACQVPTWLAPACLGQRMMMYQPNAAILDGAFMVAAIRSYRVQKVLTDWAGGSTVGHVRVSDIRRLPVPVPPLGEQRAISAVLGESGNRESAERSKLGKLRLLKAGLMEDLLTGRVRVTDLPDTLF